MSNQKIRKMVFNPSWIFEPFYRTLLVTFVIASRVLTLDHRLEGGVKTAGLVSTSSTPAVFLLFSLRNLH